MGNDSHLTDLDFWLARQQAEIRLPEGGTRPTWFRHVAHYLPVAPAWRCLEVGVVPGSTLLFFAAKCKYSCTGIDFSPRVHQLKDVFAAQGLSAEFTRIDFLTWETSEQFDLVYSCGFIEHFENYQPVVDKHWTLVRPGGMMLLTVPTMTPVQKWIRLLFYNRSKMKEVVNAHNFEIMGRDRLFRSVAHLSECKILVSTYTSEMAIWFGPKSPGIRPWTRPLFVPLHVVEKTIRKLGISSRWFSPTAVVLAEKMR